MEDEELNAKQTFLRESILEKGYDAEDFMKLLQSKKGESGLDLNSWTMNELKEAVKEFVGDKGTDFINSSEEEKNETNVIDENNENKINEEENNEINEQVPEEAYDLDKFCQDHPEGSTSKDQYGKCSLSETTNFTNKEGIIVKAKAPKKREGGIFSKSYISYLIQKRKSFIIMHSVVF